jgi:Protein of unknown function (DUF1573)
MKKIYSCLLTVAFVLTSCHNTVNKYENTLGIKPAVVAQIDTANYTTILWADTVKNFGTVKEGDIVLIKFSFKNTGDKALFITDVQPSCGCVVSDYPKDAILPGKGGDLKATFNSKYHPGYTHKTILVTSNTSNKINHMLYFYGEVRDSLQ